MFHTLYPCFFCSKKFEDRTIKKYVDEYFNTNKIEIEKESNFNLTHHKSIFQCNDVE
jgi:stress-induced morphogen